MRRTVAAGLSALALVGVTVGIGALLAAGRPPGPYERPSPPAAVGAFRDGGTPERDLAIEAALGALPTTVPARDHAAFASRRRVATAWRGLVDELDRWQDVAWSDPALESRTAAIQARAAALSDQLAAARLGYLLEVRIVPAGGTVVPALHAYRIDEVAFVRANAERVRVLGVRRFDRHRVAMLGRSTDELDDPVVLLDQIDAKITEQILPVLRGQPFPLGDPDWAQSAQGRATATRVGAAIRRELRFALGPEARGLPAGRSTAGGRWGSIEARGLPAGRSTAGGRWGSIEARGVEDPAPRSRRLLTASVRHHEAQHAFDEARRLPYPALLASYVGEAASSALAQRARHELSAYLSQIASELWIPQLALWNLARHAFRVHERPLAEAVVAVVVIESLARHLGVPVAGRLVIGGRIDRDRLAALIEPLTQLDTVVLRSAAAAVWTELFAAKLPRIVDDDG